MRSKAIDEKNRKWKARKSRTRTSLGRSRRVQLTVFRSSKHIYAQLIDGASGDTIVTISTLSKDVATEVASGKIAAAKRVGEAVARAAKERNIDEVVFNRNGFLYHGRVKALADAAREAGLQF